MRIGVICPSEIAARRFMPALVQCEGLSFAGVGVYRREEREGTMSDLEFAEALAAEREKARDFVRSYGGKVFDSFESVVSSSEVDAVYVPLPPALHYRWVKEALLNGKHVLVEKPSTTSLSDSADLARLASDRGLALRENYMFAYHNQINALQDIVSSGEIGDIRLYRISFGFPRRSSNDFRYKQALGGGALLDAGGYVIRYALMLLGDTAEMRCANSSYINGFEVDMYGSATLVNSEGLTAQVAFGMDNGYRCELEVWGSTGRLVSSRVLTAPADFVPTATIIKDGGERTVELPADDAFKKSIDDFSFCASNSSARQMAYRDIVKQASLIEEFRHLALRR